ncbi:MAG: hypothetical protein RIS45_1427, partial [Planctomycetota bacterium]
MGAAAREGVGLRGRCAMRIEAISSGCRSWTARRISPTVSSAPSGRVSSPTVVVPDARSVRSMVNRATRPAARAMRKRTHASCRANPSAGTSSRAAAIGGSPDADLEMTSDSRFGWKVSQCRSPRRITRRSDSSRRPDDSTGGRTRIVHSSQNGSLATIGVESGIATCACAPSVPSPTSTRCATLPSPSWVRARAHLPTPLFRGSHPAGSASPAAASKSRAISSTASVGTSRQRGSPSLAMKIPAAARSGTSASTASAMRIRRRLGATRRDSCSVRSSSASITSASRGRSSGDVPMHRAASARSGSMDGPVFAPSSSTSIRSKRPSAHTSVAGEIGAPPSADCSGAIQSGVPCSIARVPALAARPKSMSVTCSDPSRRFDTST